VRFIEGAAGQGRAVTAFTGILEGIGGGGELLLTVNGERRSFVTGELDVYGVPGKF
jgi:hypothetical protein